MTATRTWRSKLPAVEAERVVAGLAARGFGKGEVLAARPEGVTPPCQA